MVQRVRRAPQGGKSGSEQEAGADAAAFVAFDRLSAELDKLFIGSEDR